MAKKTMQSKVVALLESGKEVTSAQIQKIGLANPHDAIYKMRQAGYPVYSNKRVVRGVEVTAYRIGTPRGSM